MKVIYNIGNIKKVIRNAVLAIGVFDGLHYGHQQLIKRAIKKAKELKGKVVVLTFHPHPVQVLRPKIYLPYIVSLPYRLKLIDELGVDICIVQKFSKKFSKLSPKQFIQNYLLKFVQPKEIIVGDDFRFGKDRGGDLDTFREIGKKEGFKVNALGAIKGGRRKIGSTVIRRKIADGRLKQARDLLSRDVSIFGRVVKGESRGKLLGYPTANIVPNGEVLPPLGVYAVKVRIGNKKYKGMANLGRRPSFAKKRSPINIEVHIFNFHRNLYDKEIVIEFIKKIRNEKHFKAKEHLINQLKKDEEKARSILK